MKNEAFENRYGLCRFLLSSGKDDDACDLLVELLGDNLTDLERGRALFTLAQAEDRRGNTEKAIELWKESITFFPGNMYAYVSLKHIYKQQGNVAGILWVYLTYWRNVSAVFKERLRIHRKRINEEFD